MCTELSIEDEEEPYLKKCMFVQCLPVEGKGAHRTNEGVSVKRQYPRLYPCTRGAVGPVLPPVAASFCFNISR